MNAALESLASDRPAATTQPDGPKLYGIPHRVEYRAAWDATPRRAGYDVAWDPFRVGCRWDTAPYPIGERPQGSLTVQ